MANTIRPIHHDKGAFGVLASGASTADAAVTVSTTTGTHLRIHYYTVKYSAAPTQTGVLATLDSGIGAAYDTQLVTGTANVQNVFYQFNPPLVICEDDQLDVLAPAAGGVITSAVAIYGERI